MATIRRLVVTWQGLTALPGVSVFYAPAATDPRSTLRPVDVATSSECWTVPPPCILEYRNVNFKGMRCRLH